MINIQSTLRTAPDLCTNVALAVLICNSGNSYTVSTQSDVYGTYTCSSKHGKADLAQIKRKAMGQQCRQHAILGMGAIGLAALF
jgi:hypothetical protein